MTSAASVQLNDEQQQAVETALEVALEAGHMALIGPAGTGKTTTIRAIAHRIAREFSGKSVLLLAPTHKARLQFSAAALPYGAQAWTVAKFCQVKPTMWRDQDRFTASPNDLRVIAQLQGRFAFVIVDESSMVTHELASRIVDICQSAGIGVMFAGDPYQLPPVGERPPIDDGELLDEAKEIEPESAQAPEFVDAPVTARLHKVMRHGGPILDLATGLRSDWGTMHAFPVVPVAAAESEIKISAQFGRTFVAHMLLEFKKHGSGDISAFYAAAPRALCHQNRTVISLTKGLREELYGEAAIGQWQVGEIITFPTYTKTDVGSIHSSSDAVVVDTEIVQIPEMNMTVDYQTQARQLAKRLDLSFSGRFQRLTVRPVRPDGTVHEYISHVVMTPLCDDPNPRRIYAEARQQLQSRRLPSDHSGWTWLKGIKDAYLTPIYSAFVMTIHKSQGSTFDHVYVSRDILFTEDRETRNSLLYVAATRASKTLTFSGPYGA
jgi:exodeoxyribonuclease-5